MYLLLELTLCSPFKVNFIWDWSLVNQTGLVPISSGWLGKGAIGSLIGNGWPGDGQN